MMNQIVVELFPNHPVQEEGFTVSELLIEAKSLKSGIPSHGCQIDSHVILLYTVKSICRIPGD